MSVPCFSATTSSIAEEGNDSSKAAMIVDHLNNYGTDRTKIDLKELESVLNVARHKGK